jgi:hypothetical protein
MVKKGEAGKRITCKPRRIREGINILKMRRCQALYQTKNTNQCMDHI